MLTRLLPAFASLPLLLSACGGSGTSPTGTGATGGGSLPASSLSVTFSELPAYGTASLSADLFLRGFAPKAEILQKLNLDAVAAHNIALLQ